MASPECIYLNQDTQGYERGERPTMQLCLSLPSAAHLVKLLYYVNTFTKYKGVRVWLKKTET